MLATLYKDERCQHLPAYNILEKMYLDRIIRRSELQEFQGLLQPHQSVTLDGNSGFKSWLRLLCILSSIQHHLTPLFGFLRFNYFRSSCD